MVSSKLVDLFEEVLRDSRAGNLCGAKGQLVPRRKNWRNTIDLCFEKYMDALLQVLGEVDLIRKSNKQKERKNVVKRLTYDGNYHIASNKPMHLHLRFTRRLVSNMIQYLKIINKIINQMDVNNQECESTREKMKERNMLCAGCTFLKLLKLVISTHITV